MTHIALEHVGVVSLGLALALSYPADEASAAVDRPQLSLVSVAALTGVDGNSATGTCALLVSGNRGEARLHCIVAGGRPLTGWELFVDGITGAVASGPVSGAGPFDLVLNPSPASLARALPAGDAWIQGVTDTGTELSGRFADAEAIWMVTELSGAEAVPPSGTTATGSCVVATLADPPLVGVDCTHTLPDAGGGMLRAGPRDSSGTILNDFSGEVGEASVLAWQNASADLLSTLPGGGVYVEVTAGEGNAIRGQLDRCRQTHLSVCYYNRFRVTVLATTADGTATPAPGAFVAERFVQLSGSGGETTFESGLFNGSNDRDDWALLVELGDGCNDASFGGWLLNTSASQFETYLFTITVDDLATGQRATSQVGAIANVSNRGVVQSFPCPES